jgi:S1-C subfamily serine protease
VARKRVSPDALGKSVKVPAWRGQFLPKSVLGITALVLAFAVGAAASGAVLYAYYEDRTTKNERRITDLIAGFDTRYRLAMGAIEGATAQAQTDLAATTGPLAAVARAPEARKALIDKTSAGVWFVSTLDEAGLAVGGSAFVVASDSQQSYLITSYSVVRAATFDPAPAVYIRKEAGNEVRVRVWAWQAERDLAVLVVDRPNLPRLEWDVEAAKSMRAGDRLFAVSGLGAAGGSVDDAVVVDVSAGGIQHSAPLGASFVGGPLVTLDGKVVGVSSRTYSPLGYPPLSNFFAPPITAVCERLLSCNNDTATGVAGEADAAGEGSGSGSQADSSASDEG